jgi:hypothetical protein
LSTSRPRMRALAPALILIGQRRAEQVGAVDGRHEVGWCHRTPICRPRSRRRSGWWELSASSTARCCAASCFGSIELRHDVEKVALTGTRHAMPSIRDLGGCAIIQRSRRRPMISPGSSLPRFSSTLMPT